MSMTNVEVELDLGTPILSDNNYNSSASVLSIGPIHCESDIIDDEQVNISKGETLIQSSDVLELKKEDTLINLDNNIERLPSPQTVMKMKVFNLECENQITHYQREIELFKQEHELDVRTQASMQMEIDALKKQYEIANKERETIVMRYAMSEMELINQHKLHDNLEKKISETMKEKEVLSTKLKNALMEKTRVNQLFVNKCSELSTVLKDVEKLKEDLISRDIKLKWTQNKLKTEYENHKESEGKIEKLSKRLLEAEEEIEKSKKDAETAIKQFQSSQDNKAYILEKQLTELQAQLILERHNLKEKENTNKQLQQQVETLQNKHILLVDESNALKLKVSSLEREDQNHHQAVSRLQECVLESSLEIDQLHQKTSTLEHLKLQLQQEQDKVEVLQFEVAQLKSNNVELLQDMASCREREADMLEFTQQVTAKNVRLQSDYSIIEAKARQLKCEEEPLQQKIDDLLKRTASLENEVIQERIDRDEEKKLLARHLAEKSAKIEVLSQELDNIQGENQVLKHKHSVTLRELNREILQYRRRLENLERSAGSDSNSQVLSDSSCNSLNDDTSSPSLPVVIQSESNDQRTMDRILKIQKENVRLREKIDFLEEHCKQLVAELQKKTRVLQSYILREEAGTLTSGSMDLHKAELVKHGGIMASVYGSKPVDDSMTLELSLEINRKLQAVLEDTLIKNITLKENLDTLGDEIRRLSKKS